MNTPLQQPKDVKGWVMLGVSVLITVAGSWVSISERVEGYLNKRLVEVADTMTLNLAAVMQGQMLLMQDSISAQFAGQMDSLDQRFTTIEEKIGLRPVNRSTVMVTPPDTVALRTLQRRMDAFEATQQSVLEGIDALLSNEGERRKQKTWPKR